MACAALQELVRLSFSSSLQHLVMLGIVNV